MTQSEARFIRDTPIFKCAAFVYSGIRKIWFCEILLFVRINSIAARAKKQSQPSYTSAFSRETSGEN